MFEVPLITSVKLTSARRRSTESVTADGSATVLCLVDTVDGSLLLKLTQNAAHELNALLDELLSSVIDIQ